MNTTKDTVSEIYELSKPIIQETIDISKQLVQSAAGNIIQQVTKSSLWFATKEVASDLSDLSEDIHHLLLNNPSTLVPTTNPPSSARISSLVEYTPVISDIDYSSSSSSSQDFTTPLYDNTSDEVVFTIEDSLLNNIDILKEEEEESFVN
jgi:hypothetical protein